MGHPAVNRYRSGVKRPNQQVVTSHNTDGSFTVAVLDGVNMRLHKQTFPGARDIEEPKGRQGSESG
jgi:hypothetical protein